MDCRESNSTSVGLIPTLFPRSATSTRPDWSMSCRRNLVASYFVCGIRWAQSTFRRRASLQCQLRAGYQRTTWGLDPPQQPGSDAIEYQLRTSALYPERSGIQLQRTDSCLARQIQGRILQRFLHSFVVSGRHPGLSRRISILISITGLRSGTSPIVSPWYGTMNSPAPTTVLAWLGGWPEAGS